LQQALVAILMGQLPILAAAAVLLLVTTQWFRRLFTRQPLVRPLPELLRGHQALVAQALSGLSFLQLAEAVRLAFPLGRVASGQAAI